ncbi:hypothetical protein PIB30_107970, partial [Stylosanthes scabra]|nr:hypothetical protein [Stylosanthes scabra]
PPYPPYSKTLAHKKLLISSKPSIPTSNKFHIWNPHQILFKTHRSKFTTMPRMKKTIKRARGESSMEPPPWNHPLA